jgi:hypothetical protein
VITDIRCLTVFAFLRESGAPITTKPETLSYVLSKGENPDNQINANKLTINLELFLEEGFPKRFRDLMAQQAAYHKATMSNRNAGEPFVFCRLALVGKRRIRIDGQECWKSVDQTIRSELIRLPTASEPVYDCFIDWKSCAMEQFKENRATSMAGRDWQVTLRSSRKMLEADRKSGKRTFHHSSHL